MSQVAGAFQLPLTMEVNVIVSGFPAWKLPNVVRLTPWMDVNVGEPAVTSVHSAGIVNGLFAMMKSVVYVIAEFSSLDAQRNVGVKLAIVIPLLLIVQ